MNVIREFPAATNLTAGEVKVSETLELYPITVATRDKATGSGSTKCLILPREIVREVFHHLASRCRIGDIISLSSGNRHLYVRHHAWREALVDGYKLAVRHQPSFTIAEPTQDSWKAQFNELLVLCVKPEHRTAQAEEIEQASAAQVLVPWTDIFPAGEKLCVQASARARAMVGKAASDADYRLNPIQLLVCSLCTLIDEGSSSAVGLFNALPHARLIPFLNPEIKSYKPMLDGQSWTQLVATLEDMLEDLPRDCGARARQLMMVLIGLGTGNGTDLYAEASKPHYTLMACVLKNMHKLKGGEAQGRVLTAWLQRLAAWALPKMSQILQTLVKEDKAIFDDVHDITQRMDAPRWAVQYLTLTKLVLNLFCKWESDAGKRADLLGRLVKEMESSPDYSTGMLNLSMADVQASKNFLKWWTRRVKKENCAVS